VEILLIGILVLSILFQPKPFWLPLPNLLRPIEKGQQLCSGVEENYTFFALIADSRHLQGISANDVSDFNV
jgi:hypothetical protein